MPAPRTQDESQAACVCAAVNANIILYLRNTGIAKRAVEYLLRLFRAGTETQALVYYSQPMSLYYLASRALFCGVSTLAPAAQRISARILAEQQSDGSFGDELRTAMAISSLINLGEDFLHSAASQAAMQYLIAAQGPDGSWRRVAMYRAAGSTAAFGSKELTTALCVEAFSRYSAA